jgi:hypothetical protein
VQRTVSHWCTRPQDPAQRIEAERSGEGLGHRDGAKRRALEAVEAVLVALASAPVPAPVPACVDRGLVNLPRGVPLVALVLPL